MESTATTVHKRGNDFSVGVAKIIEKQSRQLNSKYNFVQYVFCEKDIRKCTMGTRAKRQKLGNF